MDTITHSATTTDYSQQPPQLPLEPQPHEHWQHLQTTIAAAISDHIPTTTSFPKHPWITQATWQLIQQRSSARLSQRYDLEAQLHKDIRKQARKDKTQWLKDRLAESEATLDPRQKWKWIKRVRSDYKPRPVSIRDSQGKPTSLSQQAQTFAEYLRDWAAPPTPYTGPTSPIHPAAAVDLTPFKSSELKATLKELAHNKAPGPDGIPAEAWQWLDEHNQAALLKVLNQSLLTATIPDDWHKAIVVEIYKGKGPLTDPASYRPISLLSTSYKLFAKLLHSRLQAALDDRLRETQYGFRATRSTSQPIHIIRRLIERAEATGQPLHLARLGKSIRQDSPRSPPYRTDTLRRPPALYSSHQKHLHLTAVHSCSSGQAEQHSGSQRRHPARLPPLTVPFPHSSRYGDARCGPGAHSERAVSAVAVQPKPVLLRPGVRRRHSTHSRHR